MSKRRRSAGGRRVAEARFWGPVSGAPGAETADGPEPGTVSIRPTPDPSVLIRSLGNPPLAIDHAVAERHLVAVYEEAVKAATALAAANGLLDVETDAE